MATMIETEESAPPAYSFPQTSGSPLFRGVLAVLKVLSSLKITVVLFALAIFIVFVGTLAQTQYDIWKVVHTYFRSGFVWIPFQVFFPKSFFPNLDTVNGRLVLDLLLQLNQRERATLLLVTHDRELAGAADRRITLRDGSIWGDELQLPVPAGSERGSQ